MSTHPPTAFPRGKRKTTTTTTTSSSSSSSAPAASSSAPSSESKSRPSKRRAIVATPSSSNTATISPRGGGGGGGGGGDFLFGNDGVVDGVVREGGKSSSSSSSRGTPRRGDDDGDDDDDDDDDDDRPRPTAAVTSQLPLGGGGVLPPSRSTDGKRRVPPRIEALTFSKFAKGTRVLGVVREVRDDYAVVSLPTMLAGYVRRGEGGPPLTRVMPGPNAVMAFAVLSATTSEEKEEARNGNGNGGKKTTTTVRRRRIELSPWPGHVNDGACLAVPPPVVTANADGRKAAAVVVRGRIASIEPHGCIVDLGRGVLRDGQKAFLRFDNVEGGYEIDDDDDDDDEEEDEDDDEEDDDEGGKRGAGGRGGGGGGKSVRTDPAKRRLNPHRLYDFTILPIPHPSSSSEGASGRGDRRKSGKKTRDPPSSGSSAGIMTTTIPPVVQLGLPSTATLASLRSDASIAGMPSLSSLRPGMLAEVRVEAHARNGVCVSFGEGGVYRGSIDEDHLGGHRPIDEKKRDDKGGNDVGRGGGGGGDPTVWWKGAFGGRRAKFTARIIAVDAATKIVRFSLNPHILALDGEYSSLYPHAVGAIVKNARVIRVDPGIGALLALPPPSSDDDGGGGENEKGRRRAEIARSADAALSNNLLADKDYLAASGVATAYVHISKSMDNDVAKDDKKDGKRNRGGSNPGADIGKGRTPEATFARHFALNARIKSLRILSTANLFDGIASCATARSIVEAHVLTHADVRPGRVYDDVPVLQLLDSGGVLVDLGVGTRGIIPAMHLFDRASHGGIDAAGYRSKIRLAKYKVGNAVTVRCLTVDPASRQCVLTAKKTLLSNDVVDPITEYPPIKPGRIAAGFISKVDDTGLTVTFYNNVHGRVSSRSLASELGVEDPKLNYNVGDVVAARVVDCVRRRDRRATTNADEDDDDDAEENAYYYQLKLSLKTIVENKTEDIDEVEATTGEVGGITTKDDTESVAVPLAAGSLLMPKRMKVLQLVNCLRRDDGLFLPGYAIVSIKSKFFTGPLSNSSGGAVECKLPYDQLMDSYGSDLSTPPVELDGIAQGRLTVGKRIDAEGLVLSVPNGADALPIVTLRSSLIDTIRKNQSARSSSANGSDDLSIVCPSRKSNIFMGEYVRGYVTRIDKRFGAFVRFLDGLTGLIPKLKKGLDEKLYDSILCEVTALDVTSSPPKILLKRVSESEIAKKKKKNESKNRGAKGVGSGLIQVGDIVGDVKVVDMNFARLKVFLLNNNASVDSSKVRARIHITMASAPPNKTKLSKKEKQSKEEHKIGKSHPFYGWKLGDVIPGARCVAVDNRDGVLYVELANLAGPLPRVVSDPAHLPPGSVSSAVVTSVSTTPSSHHGLWVQVCPGISGFVPALELSADADVLNDLQSNYKVGTRITCCVMEGINHGKKSPLPGHRHHRLQTDDHDEGVKDDHQALDLSVLMVPDDANDTRNSRSSKQPLFKPTKPQRGDVVVGRISTKSRMIGPPSLMLNLRGNVAGRCCITELADVDSWDNMPLGNSSVKGRGESGQQQRLVVSSDSDAHEEDDASDGDIEASGGVQNDYPDGKYVNCRVLGGLNGMVELSLRHSRLKGNMDDDRIPSPNETSTAYVVATTGKGCFVRLSRSVEGRVILKELSDDFVLNPATMFPPGRLIVGKVKTVKESQNTKKGNKVVTMVDMDLRESVLLASGDRVSMEDIQENSKYTGVITRVESYGVFVRIDNSDVSGLAHVSECSDNYIKNIFDLYNPGDFVKLIVLKMDNEQKRLAFSLKASNFVDDDDSDDDSASSSGSESSSDEMDEDSDGEEEKSIDSEDEDFASKLAKKMEADEEGMDADESTDADDSSGEGSSDGESSDDEDDDLEEETEAKAKSLDAMDTDVGFDWGASTSKPTKSSKLADNSSDDDESSNSSEDERDDDADIGVKSSHQARKKAAAKKREEEETSRREAALADGTADETPENSADFERLVASSPNSSEVWIKYMAFHLSLADIDSARNVANRAFERIEFRQEGEKLNVWTALLTLELKYGTNNSLHDTVDRACQHNNPKQVYLRVCELMDREVDAAASASGSSDLYTSTKRADEMFKKMCKKFKSKKSVWIAHFQYLLKGSRHEEAHALLKRSLQSLCQTKHVEVMSKFAQMEFELGSPERGRTIFNALLQKYPKRMDLLFVNIDKEVKSGDIAKARSLFDSVVNPVSSDRKFKFSDKQMKSLFKKWYRMEEEHGDEESQDRVKEEARAFVAKSNS